MIIKHGTFCAMPFNHSSWKKRRNHFSRLKDGAGNVLFIILLVVALFAALAYAVTQSTRSGGGDASREQAGLLSSQFQQYGSSLQTAIMRMKISNSCTDEQISFENLIIAGYTNPNSPNNYTCHVFRPEGGGLVFQKFKIGTTVYEPRFNANNCVIGIGTGDTSIYPCSLSSVDLIIHIQIPQSQSNQAMLGFCEHMNKSIGGGIPNEAGITTGNAFTGSYLVGNMIVDDVPTLQGKNLGCFFEVEDSTYHIYFVLVAR